MPLLSMLICVLIVFVLSWLVWTYNKSRYDAIRWLVDNDDVIQSQLSTLNPPIIMKYGHNSVAFESVGWVTWNLDLITAARALRQVRDGADPHNTLLIKLDARKPFKVPE